MGKPAASLFTPAGHPGRSAEQVVVSLDEFEAIRLADREGLKQEDAAEQMQVSRPTFGRVLESAHRKVADALVHGKPLKIEGGPVCTLEPVRAARLPASAAAQKRRPVLGGGGAVRPRAARKARERRNKRGHRTWRPAQVRRTPMNICIPVTENKGLQSAVSSHFGSAPAFLIVDTETDRCRAVVNRDQHHSHGMCQPLASLNGESIDAIVVGGIGAGAISKLQSSGIGVFLAEPGTASDIVSAFKAGKLEKATPATACAHHGAGCHTDASAA